jgi:hypothetical protein
MRLVIGLTMLALLPLWGACASAPAGRTAAPSEPSVESASAPDTGYEPDTERWAKGAAQGVKTGAVVVGKGLGTGAKAVGRGLGTAFEGVRKGFQSPEEEASYGAYPEDYAHALRGHFVHVLRYPDDARFRFGRPEKGYMNGGLLRGGGVEWQGYLVDVEVEFERGLAQQTTSQDFVARLRDGQVVDVHKDARLLHRVED